MPSSRVTCSDLNWVFKVSTVIYSSFSLQPSPPQEFPRLSGDSNTDLLCSNLSLYPLEPILPLMERSSQMYTIARKGSVVASSSLRNSEIILKAALSLVQLETEATPNTFATQPLLHQSPAFVVVCCLGTGTTSHLALDE